MSYIATKTQHVAAWQRSYSLQQIWGCTPDEIRHLPEQHPPNSKDKITSKVLQLDEINTNELWSFKPSLTSPLLLHKPIPSVEHHLQFSLLIAMASYYSTDNSIRSNLATSTRKLSKNNKLWYPHQAAHPYLLLQAAQQADVPHFTENGGDTRTPSTLLHSNTTAPAQQRATRCTEWRRAHFLNWRHLQAAPPAMPCTATGLLPGSGHRKRFSRPLPSEITTVFVDFLALYTWNQHFILFKWLDCMLTTYIKTPVFLLKPLEKDVSLFAAFLTESHGKKIIKYFSEVEMQCCFLPATCLGGLP